MSSTDIHEVFSKIFDHRPFLKTEIEFFKREFEDKRQDKEVEQLFRALELTTEIKQAQVEKVVEASDANLPRTIADIEVALRMCYTSLDSDTRARHATAVLEERRRDRLRRVAAAEEGVQEKLAAIDQTFSDKENDLRIKFEKLQLETLRD